MPEPSAFHASLARGSLLLQQDRPREALPFIQAAITANPDSPQGYAVLAQCWNELPAERGKAIAAINRAIGLEPTASHYFGLKGWFLVCQMKYMPALHAAQQGLLIDPNCLQSLNALANAHTKLSQWKKAEAACRRILELSPHDPPGLNLLAQALRYQGRWKESRETVERLLARLPNNSFGQANAGHGALAAGDHLRANEHFLQALRMDPHSNSARRGLLSSLRARIWILRVTMRLMTLLRRPPTFRNLLTSLLVFWGTIFCIGAISAGLEYLRPNLGESFIGLVCLGVLLYIALFAVTAIIGDCLLLFDPLGRHAMTRDEKIRACMPGFGFCFAVGMIFMAGAWQVGLGFVLLIAVLIFFIRLPLIKDRWQRRRESRSED